MPVNADGSPFEAGDVPDDEAASLADWPAPGAAPAEDDDEWWPARDAERDDL